MIRAIAISLAALSPLASRLAPEADAKENNGKQPNTVAEKAKGFTDSCVFFGGVPTLNDVKPDSVTVSCNRKNGSKITCTFTDKSEKCNDTDNDKAITHPVPGDVPTTPLEPTGSNLTPFKKKARNRRKR